MAAGAASVSVAVAGLLLDMTPHVLTLLGSSETRFRNDN
jgi:hypothetical protein